jgi:lipoyl(octanoyl) transferase
MRTRTDGTLHVVHAGRLEHGDAWARQRELAAQPGSWLMLVEHPPVFTIGKNGRAENVIDAHGIPVVRIDRGGDVTYHGPGQLVGYPIVDVRRLGVRGFVESVEGSIVDLLRGLGVPSWRKPRCVGVWAAGGKLASIGVRVSRGISTHGFALNVSNDLEPFARINPCGVPGCAVTSVSRELGRAATVEEAAGRFRLRFGEAVLSS